MHRWFFAGGLVAIAALAAGSVNAGGATTTTPLNVDVSQRATSESEDTVAINPKNPKNVVIVSNVEGRDPGLFIAVSVDGGTTWAKRIIANNDNLGDACCDPSLAFDEYGNAALKRVRVRIEQLRVFEEDPRHRKNLPPRSGAGTAISGWPAAFKISRSRPRSTIIFSS